MAQQVQTPGNDTQRKNNRFTISQFSDQSRQNYRQFEEEFNRLEGLVTNNIRDEYYRQMVLSRLEEISMWVSKAISDNTTRHNS